MSGAEIAVKALASYTVVAFFSGALLVIGYAMLGLPERVMLIAGCLLSSAFAIVGAGLLFSLLAMIWVSPVRLIGM